MTSVLTKRQGLLSLGAFLALYFHLMACLRSWAVLIKHGQAFSKKYHRAKTLGDCIDSLLTILLVIALVIPVLEKYFVNYIENLMALPVNKRPC